MLYPFTIFFFEKLCAICDNLLSASVDKGPIKMRTKKRILYTSPKNAFQKLHFPEKHLAETTLSRIYISLNVNFPEITFP